MKKFLRKDKKIVPTLRIQEYSNIIGVDFNENRLFIESTVIEPYMFAMLPITKLSNKQITTLKNWAFYSCYNLQLVNLPNCSYIGDNAFYWCNNLSSVNLPNCSYIGSSAFEGCSNIQSINLPNCSYIGDNAFYICSNLTNLTITYSSVPTLGNSAFYSCNYLSIYVPSSLYNSYITATNWAYYSSRIVSI